MATRYSQPQSGARIDWANPITRGLVSLFIPSGAVMRDIVAGVNSAPSGSPAQTVGPRGVMTKFAAGTDKQTIASKTLAFPLSIAIGCRKDTTNDDMPFGSTAGTQNFLRLQNGTAVHIRAGSGAVANYIFTNATSLTGYSDWLFAASSGPLGATLFRDGKTVQNITGLTPIDFVYDSIGTAYTGGFAFTGGVEYVAVWNRRLSDSESLSVNANPWQIFQPTNRQLLRVAVGNPALTASLTSTDTNETVNASATVVSGVAASFASTELADTVAAVSTVTVGIASTAQEAATTVVAASSVTVGALASGQESAGTAAAATTIAVGATGAGQDTNETLSAAASIASGVVATGAASESADTLSAASASTIAIGAAGAGQDSADTTQAFASAAIAATLSVADAQDTAIGVMGIPISATASGQDGSEQLASSAAVSTSIIATLATTDGKDTLTASVGISNAVLANLTATDGADLVTGAAGLTVGAVGAPAESSDSVVGAAQINLTASASIREAGDSVFAQVSAFISAQLLAVDSGDWLAGGADNGLNAPRDPNRTLFIGPEVRGVSAVIEVRTARIPLESRLIVVTASSTVIPTYS